MTTKSTDSHEEVKKRKRVEDEEDEKLHNLDEDEDDDGDDDSEESQDGKAQSKLTKTINKTKKKVAKKKDRIRQEFLNKLQILIFILGVILVLSWSALDGVFIWLSGQEKVLIEHKTTDNGCYEIVHEGNSYCVDEESYNLAEVGYEYLMDEWDYHYVLRSVD